MYTCSTLTQAISRRATTWEINSDHYIARLTLANIATREWSYDEVLELLLPLMQSQQLSPVNYAVAAGKCAYAYEKMGEYATAFAFYQDSNQVLHQVHEPQMQNMESLYAPGAIRCIDQAIPDFDFSRRSGTTASPVFFIGFPRSGTTLLDQILSSHARHH